MGACAVWCVWAHTIGPWLCLQLDNDATWGKKVRVCNFWATGTHRIGGQGFVQGFL